MKYSRIVITGDFFRVAPNTRNARFSFSNGNIQWLNDLLSPAIEIATGQKTEVLCWTSSGEGFDGNEFYSLTNRDASTESWYQSYHRIPTNEEIEYCRVMFEDCLVVGFELSPFQKNIFDALGVDYISFAIHPLRFSNDYFFMVASNFADHSELSAFTMSLEQLKIEVGLMMTEARRCNRLPLIENSALVCGQVEVDASLIHDQKMLSLGHFHPEIDALAAEHDHVYFKVHPYSANRYNLACLMHRVPSLSLIENDIYTLFAHDEIRTVAAISSSVLSEAVYFGKETKAFSPAWQDKSQEPCYVGDVVTPTFWKKLLGVTSSSFNDYVLPEQVVKKTLGVSWSTQRENVIHDEVPFGKILNLNNRTRYSSCLERGAWHAPEHWGTWSSKDKASLVFRLPAKVRTPIMVKLTFKAFNPKNGKVNVFIYSNGFCVHHQLIENDKFNGLHFVIPAQAIPESGFIQLEIESRQEFPPLVDWKSKEKRHLSFALKDMWLESQHKRMSIVVGEMVQFGFEKSGNQALLHGWSGPEDCGVWAISNQATMGFYLEHVYSSDICFTFKDVVAFVNHLSPKQHVLVLCNDTVVGEQTFRIGSEVKDINAFVPRHIWQENKIIEFTFQISSLQSPLNSQISEDSRYLGILVRKLRIDSTFSYVAKQETSKDVAVVGPVNITTGLAVMAQNTVLSLEESNFKGKVHALNFNNSFHKETDLGFSRLIETVPAVNIFCGGPNRIKLMIEESGDEILRNSYNICYGAWELSNLPDYLADEAYIDEYWGLSSFIADAARKKMSIPVHTMSLSCRPMAPQKLTGRDKFGIDSRAFVFLFTFCVDSTIARKNPFAVLRAFQQAFPLGTEDVSMVFKCKVHQSFPENMRKFEAFKAQIAGDKRVVLVESNLSYDENISLYMQSNAYISLHRAEGYGLTIAEAMAYGKPVIATGYSGNMDFMTPETSCIVDYDLVEMSGDEYHEEHQLWAEADVQHASYYMRKLYNDTIFRETLARRGKEHIRTNFSPYIVGQKINARIKKIMEQVK